MLEFEQLIERSWTWLERTGGYPGKMIFFSLLATGIVSAVSWYNTRH